MWYFILRTILFFSKINLVKMKFTKKETLFGIFAGLVAILYTTFIGSMCYEAFWGLTHDPRVITVEMNFSGKKYTTGILTNKTEFDSLESIYLYRTISATEASQDSNLVTPNLFISPSVQKQVSDIEIRYYAPKEGYENKYHLYGVDQNTKTVLYSINKEVQVIYDPLWEK